MGRRIVVLFLVETYMKKEVRLRLADMFATIHDINARRLIAVTNGAAWVAASSCAAAGRQEKTRAALERMKTRRRMTPPQIDLRDGVDLWSDI